VTSILLHHGTTLQRAHSIIANGPDPILELEVPSWIVALVLADPIGAGLAKGGEVRFDPGLGLDELLREWPNLPKRILPI
jgi:hypothetical protein